MSDSQPGTVRTDTLSGDFVIYQPQSGQRYTTDDMLVAWLTVDTLRRRRGSPARFVDLGSGLCAVPMIVLWAFSQVTGQGVELNPERMMLGQRSLRKNGIAPRFDLICGDLRCLPLRGRYPVVTSSPPYHAPGEGPVSENGDRARVRFELNGDIRDYCQAAAGVLAPGGLFFTVYPNRSRDRLLAAAAAAGLFPCRLVDVFGREGKPPLLTLAAFAAAASSCSKETLTVRDTMGRLTPEYRAARATVGFPPQS